MRVKSNEHVSSVIREVCRLLERSEEDPIRFDTHNVQASSFSKGAAIKQGALEALVTLGYIEPFGRYGRNYSYKASRRSLKRLKKKLESQLQKASP